MKQDSELLQEHERKINALKDAVIQISDLLIEILKNIELMNEHIKYE